MVRPRHPGRPVGVDALALPAHAALGARHRGHRRDIGRLNCTGDMKLKFDSWDDVIAFACALPDVEMLSFYGTPRSEEHTSELQSLMRISYAVFCLKKKKTEMHLLK